VKYFVTIGGRAYEVEVEGAAVAVDGTPLEAHLAGVPGTPLHHLLLGGRSWAVAAHGPAGGGDGGGTRWTLHAAGERLEADVVDERAREIAALADRVPPPAVGGTVSAPMPGLVVRGEVAVGQRVEAGAGLVVVEAMKMENELRAVRPGVVGQVHVQVGQAVEKGAPLVTLEASEASG
jgi:pyruvate carboxylase subunit B